MKLLRVAFPILTLAVLAACSSTPVTPASGIGGATAAGATTAGSRTASASSGSAATAQSRVATVNAPTVAANADAARSVYFDFDEYVVRSEFASVIEKNGRYLATRPELRIAVEGNADERGSHEYNLALGHKRAEAVARALRVYGVRDSQVEAVSWGEDKPVDQGHDEAAWAHNRRADLRYPAR